MSAPQFTASILVLSEDGGHRIVRALSREILRWLSPKHQPKAIDLEPEDEGAQAAIQSNLWKDKKTPEGHRRLVEIARTVATKIMTPSGYVFLHLDADRLWKERKKRPSENICLFHDVIRNHVEQHVIALLSKRKRLGDKVSVMSRLCLLSPYYSIESWLLQNTVVAKSLCHTHHRGQHIDKFDAWETDRGLLDDVYKPKKKTFGAGHNLELASKSYPADAVYAAGKSFTETADRLKACAPLLAALAEARAAG